LLQNIKRLLTLECEVQIIHTYREENTCLDVLENLECDGSFCLIIYEHCPVQTVSLSLADIDDI